MLLALKGISKQGLGLYWPLLGLQHLCGQDAIIDVQGPGASALQLCQCLSRATAAADICQHASEHRVCLDITISQPALHAELNNSRMSNSLHWSLHKA